MKPIRTLVYAGLLSAVGILSAQAMPAGAGATAIPGLDNHVSQIAEGCGPGAFRNARGFCRPMARRAPPMMRRAPLRACPRGMVLTRRGVCVAQQLANHRKAEPP